MAHKPFPDPPSWSERFLSVGITGTNGKTSTTSFLAAILDDFAPPVPRTTTLGLWLGPEQQTDLPQTYLGFIRLLERARDRGARFASLEVTSEVLAQGFAQKWPFRAAIFTNLSHDHLDAHQSPEHYFASKAQLFVHLPPGASAVINGADEVSPLLAEVTPAHVNKLFYGVASRGAPQLPLDVSVEDISLSWQGTRARVVALTEAARALELPEQLELGAIGEIFLENALAALIMATALGVPADRAARVLALEQAPRGRFEVVHESPHVIIDYAHTPDALSRTLRTARSLCGGELWVIFGAGGNRDKAKRPEMGKAASCADHVVLTTDNPRDESPQAIAEAIAEGLKSVDGAPLPQIQLDRGLAIAETIQRAHPSDTIVVAGKGHESGILRDGELRGQSDHELVARALPNAPSTV
ncbi:MAG: UDP-N-acetylmuramoyl-L-alanyl-D-glutamate--2,6-diaminopimelate ligase [Polyangiaceae bacterium]|nr:UDP-N-acetylmuramoyl-L-alanyl-D-glutamate--2,6-diaminopimelate ligase [Polyangiaceae bacterium]